MQGDPQLIEFKFIYNDLKQEIKQLPHLQQLLRLAQKSTKKLECINLYSIADKRDFDLQLQEKQIMQGVVQLFEQVQSVKNIYDERLVQEISAKLEKIKNQNIETFDLLNKQDQLLTQEIELVEYTIDQDHHDNQIKEEDEFQDQNMKQSNSLTGLNRVEALKKQIDDIGMKILKINGGKGKWFQSDHNDFVKIYNKYSGNDVKIIEAAVKVLGMKNTQIMDHLEIYENYLQLEKQKKLISEQYKQIKMYEKLEEDQKKEKYLKEAEEKKKAKIEKQVEENEKKKAAIQKFKEKRQEQKVKMIEQHEKKEKEKIIKIPLPPGKRKQIIDRNQKYILERQNNFKKVEQKTQQKNTSYSASKRTSSVTKIKKTNQPQQTKKI